jgi:hypothetical protein
LRTKAPVVAQKFTVDPRLLAAVEGNTTGNTIKYEDDSDDEETPLEKKARLAAEKREKLRKEFEESESNDAVCTNCSA